MTIVGRLSFVRMLLRKKGRLVISSGMSLILWLLRTHISQHSQEPMFLVGGSMEKLRPMGSILVIQLSNSYNRSLIRLRPNLRYMGQSVLSKQESILRP
jgi:hypothetical protein